MSPSPTTMTRALVPLLTLLLSSGCDPADAVDAGSEDAGDRTGLDAGPGTDSGPRPDAGADPDAGTDPDAGGRPDAGPVDPACALPAAFDVGLTYSTELFVATDGDDGNDGSAGAPLATIRAAADRATPGTRVTVRAGTYSRVGLGTVQGTATSPIAFVADGAAVIDASAGVGWAMSDAAFVVIEGFTIRDAATHGMNLDDGGSYDTPAHHVVLRNLTVQNSGSGGNNDCIKMSGVDDFWVLGSDVSGCDRGEIIDMVGCHRGVISGNYFHDTVLNGVQAKGGSSDTIIHGNLFENIPARAVNAGGSTGLPYFRPIDAPHEAANLRVLSNVFVRVGAMGGAAIAYVGCDACTFAHNTIVDPQRWVARILQESTDARFVPSRNGLFVNNVIVHRTADIRSYVNVGGGTAPETFTFANNLWYADDEGPGWTGPTYEGGVPAEVDGLIQVDPRMNDRPGGDYSLMGDSPAIGAARSLSFPLPQDRNGRCYGDPATLGAYAAP